MTKSVQEIVDNMLNGKITKLQAIDRLETLLYNAISIKTLMEAREWRNQLLVEVKA